jgi:type 1 glutamine amidotransferase
MFKLLGPLALAAAAVLTAMTDAAPAPDAAKKIRVLIVDGQNNHNWRATTPLMKKELESCGRFTVDVATAPEKPHAPGKPKDAQNEAAVAAYQKALAEFKHKEDLYRKAMALFHPDLSKYNVLLSNYNGDAWSKEVQKQLEDRLHKGKIGLVIVHAANNSFGNWVEYNRMIGMGWRGSNFGDRLTLDAGGKEVRVPRGKGPGAGHGAYHPFLITLRDTEHPITKGMPPEWMHAGDELYHGMRGPIENVHLLATAFDDKRKGGTGEHEPMMWTVMYGKGRVFHTPMGHDDRSMRCVGFVGTLQRGTEWAATGRVTLPLPKDFPTGDKTSSLSK